MDGDDLEYFDYNGLEQSSAFYKIFMLDPDQLTSETIDISPMHYSDATSDLHSESPLDQTSHFDASEDTENSQILLT